MQQPLYCFGKNPVTEAFKVSKRSGNQYVKALFCTKRASEDADVASLCNRYAVKPQIVTDHEIAHMVGGDAVHQGIVASLDEHMLYTSLDEVLVTLKDKERPLIVLLHELQDPHNVGAIIRSCVAFGASCVLMPEHNQVPVTGTVIKSSAGALFEIPLVRIGNINTTLATLKERGFWIYALTGEGETSLPGASFDTPTVIIIGNEGEGIAKKTLEHADFRLSIPIEKNCESLNASNALAVTLYEWKRQSF